jgi:hypothetical protein
VPEPQESARSERQRVRPWRNEAAWSDRLREDRAILQAQLSDAQEKAIREIVESTDGEGKLEFLVVYGSVSRGEQRPDSDLDLYHETRDLAVEDQRADPRSRWHVFGVPSGALVESLRRGDEMAFDILADSLVVDVDEEHLQRPHRR